MLAIEKIILLILFLIILVISFFVLFGIGKGSSDKLLLQYELTKCCGTWRAYNCSRGDTDPSSLFCNSDSIEELRRKLNITPFQLDEFCRC